MVHVGRPIYFLLRRVGGRVAVSTCAVVPFGVAGAMVSIAINL